MLFKPATTLSALPRETRDSLFLLLVVAWVLLPQTSNLPLWASALAYTLLIWRGLLAWRGAPLPSRWTLVALTALAVAGTAWSYQTLIGRDAGVTLLAALLALKTLEMRARRDAMVIFFFGFFTVLSHFFYSQSLFTALAMVIAIWGLLAALINAHMPVGRPALSHSFGLAARMALLGAPVMVVLFLLFPRMAPLWGMPSDNQTGRSGLSDTMSVGSMANLALQESVALRVRFNTPDGAAPPQSALYFRGPVLSHFDGKNWEATEGFFGSRRQSIASQIDAAGLQTRGEAISYEVTLEPNKQPWLLALDAMAEAPELPGMPEARTFMTPELQWQSSRPITSTQRYRAQSFTDFRYGPLERDRSLAPYTALPAGFDPRTVALARQMRSEADTRTAAGTQTMVNAALERLRSGGYSYTLEPGVYGTHTADEFWFDRKAGFCEHIASAFVVLMRAMDIPARIVTGYQGGSVNSVDGYWTVRQSDAHAWAEVWMAERGWVRVDPTGAVSPGRVGSFTRLAAPGGLLSNAVGSVFSPGALQHLRQMWEALDNRWSQWVLDYSQNRQLDLLKSLGFETPSWQDLVQMLGLTVALAAALGGVWTLRQRQQHDPWLRLLAQTRTRLAQSGLPLPPSLPPRAMAASVQAQFGEQGAALSAWLLRLEQARYAPQPAASLTSLRQQWKRLRWPEKSPVPSPSPEL